MSRPGRSQSKTGDGKPPLAAPALPPRSGATFAAPLGPVSPAPHSGVLTLVLFIAWVWGAVTVAGVVLLLGRGVVNTGGSLSVARAIFLAVSSSTLTGFNTTFGLAELTRFGQTIILLLSIVGTLASLIVGGLAAKRIARLPVPDAAVITAAFTLLALASIVGLIHRAENGALEAFGALAGSAMRIGPPATQASFKFVGMLMPLFACGALGTTVLLDLQRVLFWRPNTPGKRRPRLTNFTRHSLAPAASMLLVLTGLNVLCQANTTSAVENVARAFASAMSAMGWGVLSLPVDDSRSFSVLMLLPAWLGVTLGGTAGGLGLWTLGVLLRGAWRAVMPPGASPSADRRMRQLAGVAIFYGCALLMTSLIAWGLLLSTEPISAEKLLGISFGAVANAPLASRDSVSIVGPGMFVLSGAMVAGRVLSVLAVWAMALLVAPNDDSVMGGDEDDAP